MKRLVTPSAKTPQSARPRPPRSPLQPMADRAPSSLRLAALQARADSSPRVMQGKLVQRQAEEEEPLQGKLVQRQEEEGQQAEEEEPLQGKLVQRQAAEEEPLQGKAAAGPNRTGMPDTLRSGIESLSGMDMSDVRVHGGSAKPAAVGAHAYAQGNDIHLAPGQERHLPHEAWHVVQQRQGRVRPTLQARGVAINDDPALEQEADRMGAQAARGPAQASAASTRTEG